MKDIDGLSLESLAKKYGTPVFVISAETLRKNVRDFKNGFAEKYPKVEVAYAYKANYIPDVLKILHSEGAWAEVASGFEYDAARRMGVRGSSIVFNGPFKTKEQLKKAAEENVLVNADNTDELGLLEEIAKEINSVIDVGIRISADVGISQITDRFGFNLENGEALEAVMRCSDRGLLNVVCLHIHLTSYIVEPGASGQYVPARNIRLIWPKDPEMYNSASRKISKFAKKISTELGIRVKCIDLGGGFPSTDNLEPYVDNVTSPLLSVFGDEPPILILEPGRALVKNAVSLVTSVTGVKELPSGKRTVTVDGGINILPTSLWTLQEVNAFAGSEGELINTVVYGPLCLQTDIIAKKNLPVLKRGDKVVVENVGAYNIPQSCSFIFPRPAVLMIEDGSARVIKQAETIDDLIGPE